ncbi:MAG: peroxiredoxin family protein [Chloroflexota bacterium]
MYTNTVLEKYWSIFSLLALALSAGWIVFTAMVYGSSAHEVTVAPQTGLLAPNFTLFNSGEKEFRLSDFRGRPVLINFWASWCPPCRAEMPAMQRVYEEYEAQGFVILAVNAANQDSNPAAQAFASELGLSFPILFDTDGEVGNLYRAGALPTSFFVDPQGIVQEVVIGGPMSEALLRTRVENLLEGR